MEVLPVLAVKMRAGHAVQGVAPDAEKVPCEQSSAVTGRSAAASSPSPSPSPSAGAAAPASTARGMRREGHARPAILWPRPSPSATQVSWLKMGGKLLVVAQDSWDAPGLPVELV